jgi:hypothetical protein
MTIPRYTAVVKRREYDGMIMHVYAIFDDSAAAQACADNANAWYGEDHPLTPLTIYTDVLFEPRPFPVEAFNKAFPK